MMSPMDGWTTLGHIRNDEEFSSMPVLMLTGKFPTMTEVKNYGTLPDGYLMKPFALAIALRGDRGCPGSRENQGGDHPDARLKDADEMMLNEYRRLSSTKTS